MKKRRLKDALDAELYSKPSLPKSMRHKTHEHSASPSTKASHDPAPTEHPIENPPLPTEAEKKYLATRPYRSKRGDRFS